MVSSVDIRCYFLLLRSSNLPEGKKVELFGEMWLVSHYEFFFNYFFMFIFFRSQGTLCCIPLLLNICKTTIVKRQWYFLVYCLHLGLDFHNCFSIWKNHITLMCILLFTLSWEWFKYIPFHVLRHICHIFVLLYFFRTYNFSRLCVVVDCYFKMHSSVNTSMFP